MDAKDETSRSHGLCFHERTICNGSGEIRAKLLY
jgi:hypothetical protein